MLTTSLLLSPFLAMVASMVIGMAWYSPFMFGNQWIKLMGLNTKKMTAMKKSMGTMYALNAVGAFVQAFILKVMADLTLAWSVQSVIELGFWLWLGFIVPTLFLQVAFAGKSPKLFVLDAGYQLASVIVMAVVLGGLSYRM